MIIKDPSEKKELLEQFYGKFYTESIEDINSNAYLELMRNIDFIKTYDGYIIGVEKPKIHYYTTLYYNAKTMPTDDITEEEFVKYHLGQIEEYTTDYWITKTNGKLYYISKNKESQSLRKLSLIELKEIKELAEYHKEKLIKTIKLVFSKNKSMITRFNVWQDKS